MAAILILLAAPMAKTAEPRKAAVFVENRAGAALNDKVTVLEDFLTSRITEKGFSVISREVAVNALNSYPVVGVAAGSQDPKGAKVDAQVAVRPGPTRLDQLLTESTSALRLAQSLGADYLLVASIASFPPPVRKSSQELKTLNLTHTLRVSYKVLDGVHGGTLIADTVTKQKTIRLTEDSQTDNPGILDELLDEAAVEVAENAGRKVAGLPPPSAKSALVEITVSCGMQDLANLPASVPDIRVRDDGTVFVDTNRLGIQVVDATVEVDGLAIGSAPGRFKVLPGLHKVRVTREGFRDWERTANFHEGFKLNVALQMSEAGYARWKDNTAFLFGLKTGEKLTDGAREMMGGLAQTFRQSGYRVDHQSDVKANIEAKGKSLFDGVTVKPGLFGK